jgi:hypothetical protein
MLPDMKRLAALLSVCAILLWACTGGADSDASDDDEFTLPSQSGPGSSAPGKSLAPATATITGRLGFDDIEGGCVYLEAPDGTRYEVIYPEGWTLDRSSAELRGPDGQAVRVGEPLTVRGAVANDRSSICQIGPIFVATEVEIAPS